MNDLKTRRAVYVVILTAIAFACALLRGRWLGHLLMFDEAMNLCSVRAFASGGHDVYSAWFWRYPPLFNLILMMAKPLVAGFAARAEWIPIFLSVAQVFALAALNKKIYGTGPALWSCLAFSLMPGAVFFGLWIKQDNLMTVFGLLALYLCSKQKWAWCGLALGLAFLSKEMAIFYAAAIAIMLLAQRQYRPLAVIAGLSALTSFWWYAAFSISVRQFLSFAVKTSVDSGDLWTKPWHHYFHLLQLDLGWLGVLLACAGALVVARRRGIELWPLALFLPAFVILTISKGKTPWYMISLYPALATLQGVAAYRLWQFIREKFPRAAPGAWVPATITLAAAVLLAMPNFEASYEENMNVREPGMWVASSGSRETAFALNHLVRDGQRVLITPMHFYDEFLDQPCPIFVIYLKDMPVLVRPNKLNEEQFVDAVRSYKLDWAMVSPPPGRGEKQLIEPLMRDYGLRPLELNDAVIFRTTGLGQDDVDAEKIIAPADATPQNSPP